MPREDYDGAVQHVIAKGSAREAIVRDDLDRTTLMRWIGATVERYGWECLAYCLMDTHFHLVVVTPSANLGRGMQWLLSSYSRGFNKRHEREGNLFHTRFYSTLVRSDEHLVSALVYVHLNPVRAGIVKNVDDWRWSSYAATIGRAHEPAFLATDATLELVDRDRDRAQRRFRRAIHESRSRDASSMRATSARVRRRV